MTPHTYQPRLVGGPTEYAALSTPGPPELRSAPPLEYDGPSDAFWSPESLLAQASQVEFVALDLHSEGTVDRQRGVTRFTEIVRRPRLTRAPGGDHDRARWVLEKSKRACLVTVSLSTPVRVEPDIVST